MPYRRIFFEKDQPVHIISRAVEEREIFKEEDNYYHFQLVPNSENSIPQYMKKVNGGFAKYFNLKHNRRGALFGSRYKSVPIRTDFQSDAVTRYISVMNVLDVYQPGWREKGLHDWEGAFKF